MSVELIASVIAQGERLAAHSWEWGTFAEALLEWYDPSNSVFGSDAFPGGKVPVLQVADTRSLSYAEPHIWTNSTTLTPDSEYPLPVDPLTTYTRPSLCT